MRLAAFQTDMPQNLGALMRVAVCFDAPLDVILPCGFPFASRDIKRVAMDYADLVDVTLHTSWTTFLQNEAIRHRRVVLLTTKGSTSLNSFKWLPDDVLLMGRESTGAPNYVHEAVDARVRIPMSEKARSLNIAVSAGIALSRAFNAA